MLKKPLLILYTYGFSKSTALLSFHTKASQSAVSLASLFLMKLKLSAYFSPMSLPIQIAYLISLRANFTQQVLFSFGSKEVRPDCIVIILSVNNRERHVTIITNLIISLVEVTTRQSYCHCQSLQPNLERGRYSYMWYKYLINYEKTHRSAASCLLVEGNTHYTPQLHYPVVPVPTRFFELFSKLRQKVVRSDQNLTTLNPLSFVS